MSSFEPKPPPTAGATTRILCSGVPVTIAMKILRKCGTWVAEYIVKSPPNGAGTTITARGSIAIAMSRCCT